MNAWMWLYIIHVNIQRSSLKAVRMTGALSFSLQWTTTHTCGTLSWSGCDAPALDSRQAATTAHSIAGETVRTDEHCRNSSHLQLQSPWVRFRLKVLLAKMLFAEVRVGRGDPLGAGALDLLLPFAKLLRVLGEFKQRHAIFWSFAASISHTVVRHPVFCSQRGPPIRANASFLLLSCRMFFYELCRGKWWLNVTNSRHFSYSTQENVTFTFR